jgi:hypothetical protein
MFPVHYQKINGWGKVNPQITQTGYYNLRNLWILRS